MRRARVRRGLWAVGLALAVAGPTSRAVSQPADAPVATAPVPPIVLPPAPLSPPVPAIALPPAPVEPPAPVPRVLPPPLASADQCGAGQLAWLVGRPRTEIPVPVTPSRRRVVCSTCPMTEELVPSRLTIVYDAETNRVTRVGCS